MKKLLSILSALALVFAQPALLSTFASEAIEAPDFIRIETDENGFGERYFDSQGNEIELPEEEMMYTCGIIPESYDLRDYNRVTSVKNQGNAGSCWAFAATASLESSSLTQGIDEFETTDYSEAHMVWFAHRKNTADITDPTYGEGIDAELPYKSGGNWKDVLTALSRWNGLAEESDYPFYPYNLDAMGNYGEENRMDTGSDIIIKSAERMNGNEDIKQWIMDNGAVSIAFYKGTKYFKQNGSQYSYYCDTDTRINHGVTIVGWDDNYSVDNFNASCKPSADGAWLIKDSWGTDEYDNGYFWLSYEDASIEQQVGYTTQKRGDLRNNYTYNGDSYNTKAGTDNRMAAANVFTAKEHEILSEVAFYTGNTNVTLDISIYTDLPEGFKKPVEGTLAANWQTYAEREGYHTFSVPEEVKLNPGSKFAVVVDYIKNGEIVWVPIERNFDEEDFYISEDGQSYMKSGSSWSKTSTFNYHNVTIQAFTECDHQATEIITEATCRDTGSVETICSQCDRHLDSRVLSKTDHKMTEWKKVDVDGQMLDTRECIYCGHVEQKYVQSNVISFGALIGRLFEAFLQIFRPASIYN